MPHISISIKDPNSRYATEHRDRLIYIKKYQDLFKGTEIANICFDHQESNSEGVSVTEKLLFQSRQNIDLDNITTISAKLNSALEDLKIEPDPDKVKELINQQKNDFGFLLRNLAYKTDKHSQDKLVVLLNEIGKFHLNLGEITGKINHLTDSAIIYNHIISIVDQEFYLAPVANNNPEIIHALQQLKNIHSTICRIIGIQDCVKYEFLR